MDVLFLFLGCVFAALLGSLLFEGPTPLPGRQGLSNTILVRRIMLQLIFGLLIVAVLSLAI